jgi:CheY-like chemotaxis protein
MNTGARSARQPRRILVVDDDADVRLIVALILGAAGYEVETAEDAYDALLKLYDTHPDLLLLDLMLPETDGWDVIEAVRSDPETRHLPIVAMSAMFRVVNAVGHGIQGYVRKPFDTLAMLDTLDAALHQGTASTDR